MKSILLFVALMLSILAAKAELQQLGAINDASGDDFGSGTLIYPKRDDFQPGDLDMRQMEISKDTEGYWFEATFKNPIRNPANVTNTVGSDSLADFARKGFYQFNIDIYIDTDRVVESGNTFTLPGRHVSINPADAWEKVVVLTPRPELMRGQLLDAVKEQFPALSAAEIEARVGQSIYFPTRIKVRGKAISFFVPASFFAGSDGTDWAATALVTGAIIDIPADLSLFPTTKPALERIPLGVMQPAEGYPKDTFGYSGVLPSPVVDLAGGTAAQQKQQLAAMSGLTGVALGAHAEAPRDGGPVAQPVVTMGNWFQLPSVAVPREASTPVDPGDSRSSIVKRLQTLQELLDQKLIDETEYKQQKQRILKEL